MSRLKYKNITIDIKDNTDKQDYDEIEKQIRNKFKDDLIGFKFAYNINEIKLGYFIKYIDNNKYNDLNELKQMKGGYLVKKTIISEDNIPLFTIKNLKKNIVWNIIPYKYLIFYEIPYLNGNMKFRQFLQKLINN